jgi:hypothetical protein
MTRAPDDAALEEMRCQLVNQLQLVIDAIKGIEKEIAASRASQRTEARVILFVIALLLIFLHIR